MLNYERDVIDQYALRMTHLSVVNNVLPELTYNTTFVTKLVFQISKNHCCRVLKDDMANDTSICCCACVVAAQKSLDKVTGHVCSIQLVTLQ